MTWTAGDWQRLGDRLRASRRSANFSTKEAFAEAVGISSKTYGDIEAGRLGKRSTFSFDTIAQIEDALEWEPGVSRMVLDGKAVDVYSGMILPVPPPVTEREDPWSQTAVDRNNEAYFAWLDERVERVEQRLLRVERTLRSTDLQPEGGDNGPQVSTQKTKLERLRERRDAAAQELSEADANLAMASLKPKVGNDQASGESEGDAP